MAKIAIIGAGPAGLKCAADLSEKHKVIVFEARGWAGGRVKSWPIGGICVDLGAESLEGGEKSPWITEFENYGVANASDFADLGKQIQEGLFWIPDESDDETPGDRWEKFLFSDPCCKIRALIKEAEENKYDEPVLSWDAVKAPERRFAAAVEFTFQEAADPQLVSAKARAEFKGKSEYFAPTGKKAGMLGAFFGEYADAIAKQPKNDVAFIYNSTVRSCNVTPGKKWSVATLNGEMKDFDAVILTVPVSLLRDKAIDIPGYANIYSDAAAGLDMGNYVKVAVKWPEAVKALRDALNCDGKQHIARAWVGMKPSGTALQIDVPMQQDQVFVMHMAGISSLPIQNKANLDVMSEMVFFVISELFPKLASSYTEWVSHYWSTDPHARGAYSYTSPGFAGARQKLMSLSFPGLFYAGEAMSPTLYGSLAGAHESAVATIKACNIYLSSV